MSNKNKSHPLWWNIELLEDTLRTIDTVADLSYAWKALLSKLLLLLLLTIATAATATVTAVSVAVAFAGSVALAGSVDVTVMYCYFWHVLARLSQPLLLAGFSGVLLLFAVFS